jgi:NADPH-dependent curcumin reductase CurA
MSTYSFVVLAARPKGNIIPGETFALKTAQAPTEADLKDGEVLFESNYLSLDPAMRGWLNGRLPLMPNRFPVLSMPYPSIDCHTCATL